MRLPGAYDCKKIFRRYVGIYGLGGLYASKTTQGYNWSFRTTLSYIFGNMEGRGKIVFCRFLEKGSPAMCRALRMKDRKDSGGRFSFLVVRGKRRCVCRIGNAGRLEKSGHLCVRPYPYTTVFADAAEETTAIFFPIWAEHSMVCIRKCVLLGFSYIPKNQSTRFSHNILVQIKNGMAGRQPASVFRKE